MNYNNNTSHLFLFCWDNCICYLSCNINILENMKKSIFLNISGLKYVFHFRPEASVPCHVPPSMTKHRINSCKNNVSLWHKEIFWLIAALIFEIFNYITYILSIIYTVEMYPANPSPLVHFFDLKLLKNWVLLQKFSKWHCKNFEKPRFSKF